MAHRRVLHLVYSAEHRSVDTVLGYREHSVQVSRLHHGTPSDQKGLETEQRDPFSQVLRCLDSGYRLDLNNFYALLHPVHNTGCLPHGPNRVALVSDIGKCDQLHRFLDKSLLRIPGQVLAYIHRSVGRRNDSGRSNIHFLSCVIGNLEYLPLFQVFVLNVPNGLAGYWFASDEMSTASALCLFGTQMGIAIGFLASPLLVDDHENIELIERDLSRLFRTFAGVTTLASIVVILCKYITESLVFLHEERAPGYLILNFMVLSTVFRNEPTRPPSWSRALQKQLSSEKKEPLIEPLKRLLKNKSFLILCNTYGIGIGVLNVIATLLSQMILIHFEVSS